LHIITKIKTKETNINIRNLSIGYFLKHGKQILVKNNINQELYKGEVTCLLGANGSGKSTLLRTLAGFQPSLAGEILYNNKSIQNYSDAERSLLIGLVLTDKIYAGGISVFDLVSLGRHPHTGFFGSLKKHDKQIVRNSMEKVEITHKADVYVSELSDGERQKAMIAKALAQECPIILLDEPTAFLDTGSRIEIMYLLKELAVKEQKSILLSTHDIDTAIRMGDRFWLIDKNLPFTSGMPEDLIINDIFSQFFDKKNIQFDKQTGVFQTSYKSTKDIYISGDATLCHWLGNALKKKEFNPVEETGFPQIHCRAANEFVFEENESAEKVCFRNIEELVCSLSYLFTHLT